VRDEDGRSNFTKLARAEPGRTIMLSSLEAGSSLAMQSEPFVAIRAARAWTTAAPRGQLQTARMAVDVWAQIERRSKIGNQRPFA
jgi:hypothetical protein